MPGLAAVEPAEGALHPLLGQGVVCAAGDHMVELHGDVGAKGPLDLHRLLGSDGPVAAVHVTLEGDALLRDGAEAFEREDLEPAAVGQHRPVPVGEGVEPAEGLHDVLTGAEMQVVGIPQHHLRPGALHFHRVEAAHGPVGADRHERRRCDLAMGRLQRPGASLALGGVEGEGERRVGHRMHIASP